MPRVLIAPSHLARIPGVFVDTLLGAGFELVYPKENRQMTEPELLEQLHGIDATLAGSEPYTRKVIETFPHLKVIARAGVGWDGVDIAAATEHGLPVTFAPGTNHDAVAEHVFMLMLALAKGLLPADHAIRQGKWPRKAHLPLRGQTLGIVGLGRIGKAVAIRALAFGMPVIAHEPFPDREFCKQLDIQLMELPKLLQNADYITLHIPATPESHLLINAQSLQLLKPTAFLINTARGSLIDEAALDAALNEGKLAGAALDVFENEPPQGSPLLNNHKTILTAHTAGVDLKSRDDMAAKAAEAIARLYRQEWPAELVVNPTVKDRFRWSRE